jgi:hypothetical protein
MLIYSRAVPDEYLGLLPWPDHIMVRALLLSLPPCAHTYTYLQREVERHNQLFLESVEPEAVTQTIQVSIPSSTSASGFNTPPEAPITPGERMDLSN